MIINSVASYLKSSKPSSLKKNNAKSNPYNAPLSPLKADTVSFTGTSAVKENDFTYRNKINIVNFFYEIELRKANNYKLRAELTLENDTNKRVTIRKAMKKNLSEILMYNSFIDKLEGKDKGMKDFLKNEFNDDNMSVFYLKDLALYKKQAQRILESMENTGVYDNSEMLGAYENIKNNNLDYMNNLERLCAHMKRELEKKYKPA